jgi:hypothetical protein
MTEEAEKTAEVTIGGEVISLPPLNFKGLKRIWRCMQTVFRMQESRIDPMEGVDAMIMVVVASAQRERPEITVDWVEDHLRPGEIPGLFPAVSEVISNSGITLQAVGDSPDQGEPGPAGEEAAPSPETSAA